MRILPSKNLIQCIFSGSSNGALLAIVIGCFVIYSGLIARTVIAINQRETLATQVATAQTQVSTLEINYFNLASTIDMTKATGLGFVDAPTPDFAYTNPNANDAFAIR